jgi:hypothetical protein
MVIVLIRRCVRPDKIDEFLASYKKQKPTNNPEFLDEHLTRVDTSAALPEALRNFPISGNDCITFINVARWKTIEAFEKEYSPKPGYYDPAIEVGPRVRAILNVLDLS